MAYPAYGRSKEALQRISKQAAVLQSTIDALEKSDIDRRSSAPENQKSFATRAKAKTQFRRATVSMDVLVRRLYRENAKIQHRLSSPITRYAPSRGRRVGSKNKTKKAD